MLKYAPIIEQLNLHHETEMINYYSLNILYTSFDIKKQNS